MLSILEMDQWRPPGLSAGSPPVRCSQLPLYQTQNQTARPPRATPGPSSPARRQAHQRATRMPCRPRDSVPAPGLRIGNRPFLNQRWRSLSCPGFRALIRWWQSGGSATQWRRAPRRSGELRPTRSRCRPAGNALAVKLVRFHLYDGLRLPLQSAPPPGRAG